MINCKNSAKARRQRPSMSATVEREPAGLSACADTAVISLRKYWPGRRVRDYATNRTAATTLSTVRHVLPTAGAGACSGGMLLAASQSKPLDSYANIVGCTTTVLPGAGHADRGSRSAGDPLLAGTHRRSVDLSRRKGCRDRRVEDPAHACGTRGAQRPGRNLLAEAHM